MTAQDQRDHANAQAFDPAFDPPRPATLAVIDAAREAGWVGHPGGTESEERRGALRFLGHRSMTGLVIVPLHARTYAVYSRRTDRATGTFHTLYWGTP